MHTKKNNFQRIAFHQNRTILRNQSEIIGAFGCHQRRCCFCIRWARRSSRRCRRTPGGITGQGRLPQKPGWSILLGIRISWKAPGMCPASAVGVRSWSLARCMRRRWGLPCFRTLTAIRWRMRRWSCSMPLSILKQVPAYHRLHSTFWAFCKEDSFAIAIPNRESAQVMWYYSAFSQKTSRNWWHWESPVLCQSPLRFRSYLSFVQFSELVVKKLQSYRYENELEICIGRLSWILGDVKPRGSF